MNLLRAKFHITTFTLAGVIILSQHPAVYRPSAAAAAPPPPPPQPPPVAAAIINVQQSALIRMAHLPPEVIEQQRNQLSVYILALWQPLQGKQCYAMMCPCGIDCLHMSGGEVPRLRIFTCYYPGELDFFCTPTRFSTIWVQS